MSNGTVEVHLCTITQSKHAKNKYFFVKTGISHIVKRLKLVCVFAIGLSQFMTSPYGRRIREKHLLGSELAFVNVYLILDHVPKYSITQSLHPYNPFKLDAGISRN